MSKKRWIAAAAIMSMVLTVPVGCQGTSAGSENPSAGSKDSSQEDLVVPKNQESTVPARRLRDEISQNRFRRRMLLNCSFPMRAVR